MLLTYFSIRVPAGAAHVAFPAPSKEAVSNFFISALKAGGTLHGEPKLRDSMSGYYSAAVIDFDGNSIEAVYRPEPSTSNRSQASGPSLKMVKNGSVASRSRSVKAESVAPPRSEAMAKTPSKSAAPAPAPMENAAPAPSMAPPMQPIYQVQTKPDDGSKMAKAIVGTLLGATAGAAIAYAMVKGDSQSSEPPMFASPMTPATPAPPYSQQPSAPIPVPTRPQEPSNYRAIDAANSIFSHKDVFSLYSHSAPSKNARAETLHEENNYYPPETVYSNESGGVRRSSSGSVFATRDLPLRAIEYKTRSRTFPCNPSTFISSFADKSRKIDEGTEISESTIKPAKSHSSSRASHANHSSHTTSHAPPHAASHASHSSHATHSSHHSSRCSHHSSHHSRNTQRTSTRESKSQTGSSPHSTFSGLNIPLRDGSVATFTAYTSPKSVRSPRYIPLPESNASTIFLDTVDVDTQITPDDSISQVGESRSSPGRSRHSHRSSHSKTTSHASRHSSKFDEVVKPSDSISQVSTNLTRASDRTDRTVKPSGNAVSKTGSKTSSRSSLKSSSQR